MGYFIEKIFADKVDDAVHSQFVRFSKGVFDNKAIINISRNGRIKISSTYELANDLILFAASLAKNLKIPGLVLSKKEISGLSGKIKKNLFAYNLDQEISSEKVMEIAENSYFMLLDCSAEGIELKMKKKLPKPSSKSADKVNDKFCSMILDIKFWPAVKAEFLLNLPEGKKYRTINKYEIKEILLPKSEKDFEKIRVMAKKKGKITRKIEIDEKQIIQEKEFVV